MFGSVRLTNTAGPDKLQYSDYNKGFNSRSELSLPKTKIKNVIIFGVDRSWFVRIDNKKIDILILGKWPTQGLDDTALRAEAQYLVNFSRSNRKLCIIMGATVFYLLMLQK